MEVPDSWMVYFMEKILLKRMMTVDTTILGNLHFFVAGIPTPDITAMAWFLAFHPTQLTRKSGGSRVEVAGGWKRFVGR